jgi:hypothetical protein
LLSKFESGNLKVINHLGDLVIGEMACEIMDDYTVLG